MPDRVGQQLGSYQLTRLLGEGAFAEVYLGEHVHLGTFGAIKVLHTKLGHEDQEKFRTEARTIARLIHPNIVRVLDFGVEDKTPFLVLDYAPHGTLRQRHPEGQKVPLSSVLSYVKHISDALQCAHDEKLIHRDVKPENFLLGRYNEALLSDFGIALVTQSSRYQSIQEMAGTTFYMAPEQIHGKPRPASDQYALAVVVYEWLTGERPFQGSFMEVVAQHLSLPPPPLHTKVAGIPLAVEEVIMMALEKEPSKRFKNIQAFATALLQAAQTESLSKHSPPHHLSSGPDASRQGTPITHDLAQHISAPLVASPSSKQAPEQVFSKTSASPRQTPPPLAHVPGTLLCVYRDHTHMIANVAWSPDGRYIASASYDKTVRIWEAATGQTLFICRGHTAPVRLVRWSPDGTRLASASDDKSVVIWDTATGRKFFSYQGHTALVYTVGWSPDATRVVSGSYDQTVQVWDALTGRTLHREEHQLDPNYTLVWSPDSRWIASSGSNNTVRIREAFSGKDIALYRGHSAWVYDVAWSSDSQRLASASYDRTVQVWFAATGKQIFVYQNPFDINYTLTGTHTTSALYNQTQYIWNAAVDGRMFLYSGHSDKVRGVARSPNGFRLATANYSQEILIWNAVTGHQIFAYRGHMDWVVTMAWSPDSSRVVSGSRNHVAHVWTAP